MKKGGTGLGLAIAKHAVERHGGELKIASAPGQGSEFTCPLSRFRSGIRTRDAQNHATIDTSDNEEDAARDAVPKFLAV